jgi:diguanylate cyclase (GGDEF)-like protein/PAS domain S-box-containing protein
MTRRKSVLTLVAGFAVLAILAGFGVYSNNQRSMPAWLVALIGLAAMFVLFSRRRHRLVEANEQRLSALLRNVADAVLVVRNGKVAFASDGTATVLAADPAGLLGRSVGEILPTAQGDEPLVELCARAGRDPGQTVTREVAFTRDDGDMRWASISAVDLSADPSVGGLILTCHDVTEQRRLHEKVAHQALHDSLTGLPNRALFNNRLETALKRRRRTGQPVGVLFLDLDRFKPINDRLGHEAGDRVLRTTAQRLRDALRDGDTIARMGGDEFAVVVEEAAGRDDLVRLAERLVQSIDTPVDLGDERVSVGVSIGIAVADNDLVTADDVLRNADLAMYRAKDGGGEKYRLFGIDGVSAR